MSKYRSLNAIELSVLVVALTVFALGAKGEPAEDAEKNSEDARLALTVAKIDAAEMSLAYFESAADRQSPLLRKGLADPAKRTEFLDKMINMELLAAEAVKRGFADHAEVLSVKKNQLASLMHKKIADGVAEKDPDEAAMRKYYDDHNDSYSKPEKVRARHILIKDQAKAKDALDRVLKGKMSQYEFRKLAQEKSEDDATKLRGGDLTFFSRSADRREDDPKVAEPVINAAFSLKTNGQVYDSLVKTDKGYHIIMRTGHREQMNLSFEEAKDRIGLLVKRETRKNETEAAIDALNDKFKVTLHEENLKEVVIDLSGGPPEPGAKGGLTEREIQKLKRAKSKKEMEAATQ